MIILTFFLIFNVHIASGEYYPGNYIYGITTTTVNASIGETVTLRCYKPVDYNYYFNPL